MGAITKMPGRGHCIIPWHAEHSFGQGFSFYIDLNSVGCAAVLSLLAWEAADDVGVSRVSDREAAHSIVPSTGSAKLIVVTMEVVHTGLRKHGIILNLTLAQSRAVVGNEDKLGFALAQCLQSRFESQAVLATLHHQLQASIDGVCGLGSLGLLLGGHGGSRMRNLRKAPLKGLPATSLEAINYAGKQMQEPCL